LLLWISCSRLKTLDLSENTINSIQAPQDAEDFKSLTTIRLSDNNIDNWASIDRLGLYSSLSSLWIGNNPITTKASPGASGENSTGLDSGISIIARMGSLRQLNGSEVNKISASCYSSNGHFNGRQLTPCTTMNRSTIKTGLMQSFII